MRKRVSHGNPEDEMYDRPIDDPSGRDNVVPASLAALLSRISTNNRIGKLNFTLPGTFG